MNRRRCVKPEKDVAHIMGVATFSEDDELLEEWERSEYSLPCFCSPVASVSTDTKASERGRSEGMDEIVQTPSHGPVPQFTAISSIQLEEDSRRIFRTFEVWPDVTATDGIFTTSDRHVSVGGETESRERGGAVGW